MFSIEPVDRSSTTWTPCPSARRRSVSMGADESRPARDQNAHPASKSQLSSDEPAPCASVSSSLQKSL